MLTKFLLHIATVPLLLQGVPSPAQRSFSKSPDAVVQSLYRRVISHHPLGLPSGADKRIFAPYLSQELSDKIESARACQNDWLRQNREHASPNQPAEKPPYAWRELGLFSGDEELSEPSSFQTGKVEPDQGGSYRVYVKLTEAPSNDKPWSWDVAVQVKMQHHRLVVNDVFYLKGNGVPAESRLSDILMKSCRGSRWVGNN